MLTLEALQRRIQTSRNLESIVKTMKSLAAIHMRQYERASESLGEYSRAIESGLQILLAEGVPAALEGTDVVHRMGAVVFGSDQGMCGRFNERIVRHALAAMDRDGIPVENRSIIAVGERASSYLETETQPLEMTLRVPGSVGAVTAKVQQMLIRIEEWQRSRRLDRLIVFYNRRRPGASYEPASVALLPIDRDWLARLGKRKWPTRMLPTFTMRRGKLLSALIREHLFISLFRAFVESLASENVSRLTAMHGAERNIEDRLRELTAEYHQQRQISITTELLDVVSGFEALK